MPKPNKTLADYLVSSISPMLIMLLVGSLCFFLIEVFFRGAAIGSVRWVMFWFVLSVVLVSRIGLEQGTNQAMIYGVALAGATWIYLIRIHPAFILGMILLGIVWWCAHKLTWDCTLMDEDQDASGGGLLQTIGDGKHFKSAGGKATKIPVAKIERKQKPATPHPPGLWVIYFSLAALPLFGIGQMLLPRDDIAAREMGFSYLLVYVIAALGLLLATSFLGLRRYLRQRYLQMPAMIAFGWIRFGVGVAAFVMVGVLLLPRPGANDAWQSLHYDIDYKLRQASEYAARFSPHGKGSARSGNETQNSEPSKNSTAASQTQADSKQSPGSGQSGATENQSAESQRFTDRASQLYHWFKVIFLLVVVMLAAWWIYRKRDLIFQIIKSSIAALKQFFKDLFRFGSTSNEKITTTKNQPAGRSIFASYRNPFLSQYSTWTHEQLVLYSFEALQVWAEEQGVKPRPEQTAREFCVELGGRFPEIIPQLNQLSFLYSHAAYGLGTSANYDLEPVKTLWRFLGSQNAPTLK